MTASGASGRARAEPARAAGPSTHSHQGDLVRSILYAVLVFVFARVLLVEAYRIPSSSMVPTLLVGDWLFVNKLIYGPHVPFIDVNLPGYSEPKRRDVV